MKRYLLRRALALLCCIALCFGLGVEALAYSGTSSWATAEVDAADLLGIIPASLQTLPLSSAMSRIDMCHMAVNLFEKMTDTTLFPLNINHFTDTRDADVCVAYELGIVSGYPDGTFRPNQQITRQEFSKIIANLLNVLGWSEDAHTLFAFQDAKAVSDWAKDAAIEMIRIGVVQGSNDSKLYPKSSTSVEQACVMFQRAYNILIQQTDVAVTEPAEPVSEDLIPSYLGISAWAVDAIGQMDSLGLLPQSVQSAVMSEPITRAQMCEMAVLTYRVLSQEPSNVEPVTFSDTDLPSAGLANALGIVSGFPDGTFRPDEPLTREQFFQITKNLLSVCGYQKQSDMALLADVYTDADTIGQWAQAPIAQLYRLDVMHGDNQNRATPNASTTCEQAIAMLMRTYRQVSAWCSANPLGEIVGPRTTPDVAQQVVELALGYVGYPYVWAGSSPSIGFDCSGLVYYVYQQFGYPLHRAGDGMALDGIAVSEAEMRPGDILIFSSFSTGNIQHVGLYIGDGKMVHAQSSKTGVVVSPYDYDSGKYIYSIRRIIS